MKFLQAFIRKLRSVFTSKRLFIDGDDVVALNVVVTAFGGGHDIGDDGHTESGVMNDGSNPHLIGCALPIRSTEAATAPSLLSDPTKPHIPWGTQVKFWRGDESKPDVVVIATLIDNGPDVAEYPTHLGDLTVWAAHFFAPNVNINDLSNTWRDTLNYRVFGGAKYVDQKRF